MMYSFLKYAVGILFITNLFRICAQVFLSLTGFPLILPPPLLFLSFFLYAVFISLGITVLLAF